MEGILYILRLASTNQHPLISSEAEVTSTTEVAQQVKTSFWEGQQSESDSQNPP